MTYASLNTYSQITNFSVHNNESTTTQDDNFFHEPCTSNPGLQPLTCTDDAQFSLCMFPLPFLHFPNMDNATLLCPNMEMTDVILMRVPTMGAYNTVTSQQRIYKCKGKTVMEVIYLKLVVQKSEVVHPSSFNKVHSTKFNHGR